MLCGDHQAFSVLKLDRIHIGKKIYEITICTNNTKQA